MLSRYTIIISPPGIGWRPIHKKQYNEYQEPSFYLSVFVNIGLGVIWHGWGVKEVEEAVCFHLKHN
jgi:hypothetical protein